MEDRAALVTVLLKQLHPFMSASNLTQPDLLKLSEVVIKPEEQSPLLPKRPGANTGPVTLTQLETDLDSDSRTRLYPRRPGQGNVRRGLVPFKASPM